MRLGGPSRPRDPSCRSAHAVRWPVRREHLADQVRARYRPPHARVARLRTVVAHHEVVPGFHLDRAEVLRGRPPGLLQVRLLEELSVDVHVAEALLEPHLDGVTGQPDQALDERASGATFQAGFRRRVEDDDLAAAWVPQVVDEAIREHPVGEARLTTGRRLRAMERRLHRRRRDPVRVDHERLHQEHDHDRADDGHDPVDRDA